LPEAHVEAPSVGSVILAGILLKLGGYGLLRIVYPAFSEAVFFFFPLIYVLGLLGILYPSFVAIRQVDLKRIIAYSSISHMNLTVLGLFSNSVEGIVGGCFLMLAHGIVSSLFFFLIGMLYDRHSTRLYPYYGGLSKVMPLFSFYLLIASLCNIGLPGTCNFIGEMFIFFGLILQNKLVFFFSLTTIVFSSIYTLFLFNKLCFGNLSR
jgi:NADH:ubiquinone oxidoreductase subunit 4 (subunit M)